MTVDDDQKQTVLIIDDNITNLEVAMQYLEGYSFEILTARDGLKGITRAEFGQPDLILLDIDMPGLDGFETCRRLKANAQTKRIPVIFMTATLETAAKVQGFEAGAVDYITKPFEAAELLARVNTHLALYQFQERLEALVEERTTALEAEIKQREQLWQTIHQQNEQLHSLTRAFLETQNQNENRMTQNMNQQMGQQLQRLTELLTQSQQLSSSITSAPARQRLSHNLAQMSDIAQQLQQHTQEMTDDLNQATAGRSSLLENPLLQLTNREREVVQLVIDGKTTRESALLLNVATGTISTYRRRIMEKLNVSDLAGLIRLVNRYIE